MEIVVVGLLWPVSLGPIREFHGRERGLKFLFVEQRVIAQSVVPLGEIFEIRIDAAIAERRRSRTLIGFS